MKRYNELYALAREVDQTTLELQAAHERARQETVRQPIEGDLGAVTVRGGGLASVDLDPRVLRRINGATLGPAVRRAITAAEAAFRARYLQAMADALPNVHD